MRVKRRSLILVGLVTLAGNVLAVPNTAAESGGHIDTDSLHTKIVGGLNWWPHTVKFASDGGTQIECTTATYSGTVEGFTATQVSITPTYKECRTENELEHKVTFDMKGCSYTLTFGNVPTFDNTIHLVCPIGVAGVQITHPNCTIRLPPQTPSGGIAYTGVTESGMDAITADVTVKALTTQYEAGICVFLGTSHSGTLTGSITLRGETSSGTPIGIRVTG